MHTVTLYSTTTICRVLPVIYRSQSCKAKAKAKTFKVKAKAKSEEIGHPAHRPASRIPSRKSVKEGWKLKGHAPPDPIRAPVEHGKGTRWSPWPGRKFSPAGYFVYTAACPDGRPRQLSGKVYARKPGRIHSAFLTLAPLRTTVHCQRICVIATFIHQWWVTN